MMHHHPRAFLTAAVLLIAPLCGCSDHSKHDTSSAPPPPDHPTAPPLPKDSAPTPPKEPTAPPLHDSSGAAAPAPLAQPLPVVTAPTAPPAPAPKTTMSDLRTDGNLMERHKRIVAEASQGGNEIAFIGDSITEGWAGAGKDAWKNIWEPRHGVNCGIGGDRTQHVIGRLDNGLMDALSASNNNIKWVVLMIGTNNTGGGPNGDSAADIAAGNETIINKLRAGLPKAEIALFAVFPRGQWPSPQRDTIDAINKRLQTIAARDPRHIHYIDIGPKFLKPSGELPPVLMPDFLHLSPMGYKIWSDELANVIK